MHVCLFDIDGTLLLSGGAGRKAFRATFSDEFGIGQPEGSISFAGRTDRAIVRDFFRCHGIEDIPRNWQRFVDTYLCLLREQLPNCNGRVLPGIEGLVGQLDRRRDVAVGLLTGNLQHGARTKLEHFRLADHFPFGAFGDEHSDRAMVARDAVAAARHYVGTSVDPKRILVIGDTPNDVSCARSVDARAVAVATGPADTESLAAAEPDLLLQDLSDPAPFLRFMEGQET